jgi:hypothetical protein
MATVAFSESLARSQAQCAFTLMAVDADGYIAACDFTAEKKIGASDLVEYYLKPCARQVCDELGKLSKD